jgi:hypothetical protein
MHTQSLSARASTKRQEVSSGLENRGSRTAMQLETGIQDTGVRQLLARQDLL